MRSAPPRYTPAPSAPPPSTDDPAPPDPDIADEVAGAEEGAVRPEGAAPPCPPEPESDRVIRIELASVRCFGLMRINCPAEPASAVWLAASALAQGIPDLARGVLARYYETSCPRTAADVLGLPPHHELADYPPLVAVLPWMRMSPSEYLIAMETGIRGHSLQGGDADFGVTDGHAQFGPASARFVRYEIERLRLVVESVAARGVDGPPPLGTLVVDDEHLGEAPRRVFDVRDGLHRCAAFAAHGIKEIDAQVVADIGPITRRSGSALWHHVQTGLFTEAEALDVFDRYVAGTL